MVNEVIGILGCGSERTVIPIRAVATKTPAVVSLLTFAVLGFNRGDCDQEFPVLEFK
jgi:hypothetical protein